LIGDSSDTAGLLNSAAGSQRAQAFDDLFARHAAEFRRFVELRFDDALKPRLDPSDVIQETHLDAFRRFDDYLNRRPMPFRLWLRKTALERLIKFREQHLLAAKRSVRRETRLPARTSAQLLHRLPGAEPHPGDAALRQEQIRAVREALARLSAADREILLMRYVENLNNQEIGLLLDMSSDAVSKRHGRALVRLQGLLNGDASP
jgi:RNA polymerase sigma-70 factor, ECF subfamily